MASTPPQHRLARAARQYFQLIEPERLDWPSPDVLKDQKVQKWLYDNLFSEHAMQYPPPDRYRLRVLKHLLSAIENAVTDPEEDVGALF